MRKPNRILWALLTVSLSLPGVALAQGVAEEIDALVSRYHELGQFSGAVLVAQGGEVIFQKGFGYADMEWSIPNAPDTKFRIGSVTKQFTAVMILKLVEAGVISLDGKITDYLPDYPAETGDQVTIHHLLTHTSGIPSYTGLSGFMREHSRDPYTPDELVAVFSGLQLEFEPGSDWRYNNSGYFLLGVIIEEVTGMPYDRALRDMVLDPLELDDTGYDHFSDVLPRRAAGYSWTFAGYENADYLDTSLPYAAGSMYSTVRDLFEWDRILYTDRVFDSAGTKETMFTPFLNNYAYGWGVRDLSVGDTTTRLISHGGGINGFVTGFWRLVDDEHTIIVMDNTEGNRVGAISRGIANILYGEEPAEPVQSIAQVMYDAIAADGMDVAVARYWELKETEADAYDFAERELNRLGYYYLGGGSARTAIEVFALNVEAYPESANTYDSLGEAYMTAGDEDEAIANYQKSLELDPDNDNAREMLRRMGVQVADEAPPEAIEVPLEVLQRYVGRYEFQGGVQVTVTLEGGRLMALVEGDDPVELHPLSETRFRLPEAGSEMEFTVDEQGRVTGFTMRQTGSEIRGSRKRN
jgi:CubicO group peptidase (beta-lactamase class C family)